MKETALSFEPVRGKADNPRLRVATRGWFRPRRRRLAIAIVAVLALVTSGCSMSGSNAESTTGAGGEALTRLPNNRPTGIDLSKAHPAPSDKVIGLEIEFAMRNQQQFDQFMQGLQDPHSPDYHHWMTPEEIHARFGETQEQFNAVLQWLQAQGFTITDKSYNTSSDYIRIKGTIGQIDKAFAVDLVAPQYDEYAAKNDPAIPAQFNGVISRIAGLEVVGPLN
ncbi:MAG TPA: protease pro-enzyme activation domain-containing protein [Candidatus Binataceae bacterium]|nr:protease pro-enzyme activation domain-containing protein [Candidatus Binataceae bacterium]